MNERTAFEAGIEKRRFVKTAEAQGQVADSLDVRRALMQKVHAGVLTLSQAQAELKRIQCDAKATGKMTRAQAFEEG